MYKHPTTILKLPVIYLFIVFSKSLKIKVFSASSPSVPNQTEMAEGLTVLQKLYTSKGTHDSNPSLKSWTQSEGQPVLRRLDKSNIIMGKNALLRSRSVEMQNRDAAAVHDLVINVMHAFIIFYLFLYTNRMLLVST